MSMRGVILGLAIVASGVSVAWAQAWTTYHNDRFGTTADRPADWTEGTPPTNGDGLMFSSGDGKATLTISGILSVLTPQEEVSSRLAPQEGETVLYKASGRNVVVVSGTKGDTIFYRKSLLSCTGQIWNSVSLVYPSVDKAQYDEIVTHAAASLRGGPSDQIKGCR